MKPHTFDFFDTILIIGFPCHFKLGCELNGMHKEAPVWVIYFFMKISALFALHTRHALKQKAKKNAPSKEKTIALTMYPQVVNYLLLTYETDVNIAGSENKINTFIKQSNKTLSLNTEELVAKTLCYWNVYEKQDLRKVFIK